MIDTFQLVQAFQQARRDLLAERTPEGHWVGELSNSALSTATAISALTLLARETSIASRRQAATALAERGIDWLAHHQNHDGGFGDTDKSKSNISTTYLVIAALHLAEKEGTHQELLERANAFVEKEGGLEALQRRYGNDKTFVVPILTNLALAGIVPWRKVPPLPFELSLLPQSFYRLARMPVVSYAIPALVTIGQACFFHRKPRNPLSWLARRASLKRSLDVVAKMQPKSGGFLEAVPLTSFVMMSLAATGRADHKIVEQGLDFLVSSVHHEGSWPIDENLATWVTSLSVSALALPSGDVGAIRCLSWLLSCQHTRVHPFTGAEPGGWGWTDLSGAVPDVDDTAGALLALCHLRKSAPDHHRVIIDAALRRGFRWLLDIQNKDGGFPTFCRGWGKLPFDRSSTDLTAHVLRAFRCWQGRDVLGMELEERVEESLIRGFSFLEKSQHEDGSWEPLWFGNQDHPREANPVFGTARVLLAYRDFEKMETPAAQRAVTFLCEQQTACGGFSGASSTGHPTTEETAVTVEALLAVKEPSEQVANAVEEGVRWLMHATYEHRHRETAPIGFYFAKLWYYEKLYPQIFTTSALGRAVEKFVEISEP